MKLLLISFFVFLSINLFSQDLIINKNQDTIVCKIVDIQDLTIFYYPAGSDTSQQAYRMAVKTIRKIVFADGEEIIYVVKGITKKHYEKLENGNFFDDLHKNAIKLHGLSLISGSIAFTYERSIKPGVSFELGLGYIYGIVNSTTIRRDQGYILRGGVKFMRPPIYYANKGVYAHLLKGSYLKPEIIFNSFKKENQGLSTPSLKVWDYLSSTSIVLNVGKQVVYGNVFLLDWYGFIGYGKSNYQNGYYYSNIIIANSIPVSFGFGLRIGFLFL